MASSAVVDHPVACWLPHSATAMSQRASPLRRSTMSKTNPTTSAVTNTIDRATTSISPPAARRSIERAVEPSRGRSTSQRTSHRCSASGSMGSTPPGARDSTHTPSEAITAARRTARVTDIVPAVSAAAPFVRPFRARRCLDHCLRSSAPRRRAPRGSRPGRAACRRRRRRDGACPGRRGTPTR